MKKQVALGLAAAATIAALGTPAIASAAPLGQTNGSVVEASGDINDTTNPFGQTTRSVVDRFIKTN